MAGACNAPNTPSPVGRGQGVGIVVKTSRRIEQVNDFLRAEIANIIWQEQDELRLGLVSVTEVETSADLRHARVYISTLGGEKERDAVVAVLRRRASRLRRSARTAHHLPYRTGARFPPDASLEQARRCCAH